MRISHRQNNRAHWELFRTYTVNVILFFIMSSFYKHTVHTHRFRLLLWINGSEGPGYYDGLRRHWLTGLEGTLQFHIRPIDCLHLFGSVNFYPADMSYPWNKDNQVNKVGHQRLTIQTKHTVSVWFTLRTISVIAMQMTLSYTFLFIQMIAATLTDYFHLYDINILM